MARINRIFQWLFWATVVFMAGLRSYPGGPGERAEIICACLLVFGFLAWAAIGYGYAWKLAIDDVRARLRASRARGVTVRREPYFEPAPEAEVLSGRCLCQREAGQPHAGQCPLRICQAC